MYEKFVRTVAWAVFISFAVVTTAASADLRSYTSKEGNEIVTLVGTIDVGDAQMLETIIKTANDHSRKVAAIRLNSPGGILGEGRKLADLVRYGKIATVVAAGSQCASACFLVFAAGIEKFANYNSNVGVHCASDQAGVESAATALMGDIAKKFGVPDSIIDKMMVTPPDEIVWLSPRDLRSMGVILDRKQFPTAQVVLDNPTPDQSAGVDGPTPVKWEDVVDSAFKISKRQNGGQPNVLRVCGEKMSSCNTAVLLKNKDGNLVMVNLESDQSGRMISLDTCTFNSFEDIRTCVDWNSKITTRELKDSKGNWYSTASD